MQAQSTRLVGGFALLVVVWIVTYWAWGPSEPKISFAMVPEEAATENSAAVKIPITNVSDDYREAGMGPPATPEEPAVIPPEFFAYQVLPGDSLLVISAKMFGDATHASAIAQANPMMDPTRLKPGRLIRIPRDPKNVQGLPNPMLMNPAIITEIPSEYTVQKGDSLTSISKNVYGTIKYADLIFELNKETVASKDTLRVGQTLKIPPRPVEGGR